MIAETSPSASSFVLESIRCVAKVPGQTATGRDFECTSGLTYCSLFGWLQPKDPACLVNGLYLWKLELDCEALLVGDLSRSIVPFDDVTAMSAKVSVRSRWASPENFLSYDDLEFRLADNGAEIPASAFAFWIRPKEPCLGMLFFPEIFIEPNEPVVNLLRSVGANSKMKLSLAKAMETLVRHAGINGAEMFAG